MFRALALRQSSDEGLTLETSAFQLVTVANLIYIFNFVDITKLLCIMIALFNSC